MRFITRLSIVILLAAGHSSAQVRPAQQSESGLLVGNRVDDYFGESYTSPPRQSFVFFTGEPIAFRLVIRNLGPANTALLMDGATPDQQFGVHGFVAALPSGQLIERRVVGNKFEDEREINVPIVFSTPMKVSSGGTSAIKLDTETLLDPRENIEWVMNVPSNDLEPGLYRFVVSVNGRQSGGRPLQGFGNFRFELRQRDSNDEPEILRREGLRRLFKEDYIGARQAVAELLRLHPNSYEAYETLEMIADREGKSSEAAGHRKNAEAILLGGRDELLIKYTPKEKLDQKIRSVGRPSKGLIQ
jgi:hypothetical protein